MFRLLLAVTVLLDWGQAAAKDRAMARVPAGSFVMGSERGDPDERPVRRLRLQAFWIDRFEVTQRQYGRCVAAGACRAARRYPETSGADLPAVGVSWHDADRYCRWRGARLPGEAEWERAARGTDGRRYPWGPGLDCARANFGNFAGAGFCGTTNPGRVLAPGSRPTGVSPVGAHDMAGNVWEWVADRYRRYDGRGPLSDRRVVRGGSCCSYFAMPTTTNRLAFPPEYVDRDIGFRCARSAAD